MFFCMWFSFYFSLRGLLRNSKNSSSVNFSNFSADSGSNFATSLRRIIMPFAIMAIFGLGYLVFDYFFVYEHETDVWYR